MGVFNTMGNGHKITRFDQWCALIPAAEYEYTDRATGETNRWTIHESERGQVEVQLARGFIDDPNRWMYQAPEIIRQHAYCLYSIDRQEYDINPNTVTGPFDVLAMLRLLEERGVLEFSSAPIER